MLPIGINVLISTSAAKAMGAVVKSVWIDLVISVANVLPATHSPTTPKTAQVKLAKFITSIHKLWIMIYGKIFKKKKRFKSRKCWDIFLLLINFFNFCYQLQLILTNLHPSCCWHAVFELKTGKFSPKNQKFWEIRSRSKQVKISVFLGQT